jgi:predicted MFS family arabinose efflux permease
VFLTAGVSALILLTTWGGTQYAWDSAMIVGLGIAGVVLLALFVWQERRAPEPLMPGELFHSPVFNVASAMGFTVGMAMFGAIIYIPFFLQIVFGATPTSSGLRMLPLMAGLLVASIASGRAISRMGRYRVFPIAGTAILVVGMFLLSRLEVDTPHWLASVYMAVVGVGIGLVMQVLVLVVQNDADPKDIGAATSTATFFRSLGGSFGVAIFGAIYASHLRTQLGSLPPATAAALAKVRSPEQARHLPALLRLDFTQAFAHALHSVFLWGMLLAILPFALSWFLKEVPLRTTLHRSNLGSEEAAAGGTGSEALAAEPLV